MTYPVNVSQDDQRVLFGVLTFTGSVFFGLVAVVANSSLAGDLAKIFGVGFVSALAYYFGSKAK